LSGLKANIEDYIDFNEFQKEIWGFFS